MLEIKVFEECTYKNSLLNIKTSAFFSIAVQDNSHIPYLSMNCAIGGEQTVTLFGRNGQLRYVNLAVNKSAKMFQSKYDPSKLRWHLLPSNRGSQLENYRKKTLIVSKIIFKKKYYDAIGTPDISSGRSLAFHGFVWGLIPGAGILEGYDGLVGQGGFSKVYDI